MAGKDKLQWSGVPVPERTTPPSQGGSCRAELASCCPAPTPLPKVFALALKPDLGGAILVSRAEFFAGEAAFRPGNGLKPVGGDVLSTRLALAVGPTGDSLQSIVDLFEHAASDACRGDVDVLLNGLHRKLHLIRRLDAHGKGFRATPGVGQKLLAFLEQNRSIRVVSCLQ